MHPRDGPLSGIRVLDLSRYLPGPYLTRVLADLGADVIKVEPPEGDPTRYWPPAVGDVGAAFAGLNFGKRSIAVDLKKDGGPALVLALAAKCDVLVESFRPGVLERLGLGWEQLVAANPKLVLCSISGYGQGGESRHVAGHDVNYMARAGTLGLFGPVDGAPPTPGVQVADVAGGALSAAIGVLAALYERQRTGRGRRLDVSMTRSLFAFLAMEVPRRSAGTSEPRGEGMLTGGMPCYRVYATKDGRSMALGAIEPKFFAAFCERAGVPQLALDGFSTGEAGRAVTQELESLFLSYTQAEWVKLLAGCDCCCEPVRTVEEAAADPTLGVTTVDLGGARGVVSHVGLPPTPPPAHVPELGEHGAALLSELAVPEAVVARARASGAVG